MRLDVLKKLQPSLSEYGKNQRYMTNSKDVKIDLTNDKTDTMMKDYHHAMRLPSASPRDIASIKNWLDGTGSIARAETDFLEHQHDMVNLTGALDSAVNYIEILVEKLPKRLAAHVRKVKYLPEVLKPGRSDLTQDPHIFFAGPLLRSFSRAVTSWVAAAILLAPVVVLFCIQDALWRLITITVAILFFLTALSTWTKARTIEVVTAGARYAFATYLSNIYTNDRLMLVMLLFW
jgi:hypothetical protein